MNDSRLNVCASISQWLFSIYFFFFNPQSAANVAKQTITHDTVGLKKKNTDVITLKKSKTITTTDRV